LRKFKIDAGKLEICRITSDGFRTPGVIVQTPAMYVMAKDELTFQYLMGTFPLDTVDIVETLEPLKITQPNLN